MNWSNQKDGVFSDNCRSIIMDNPGIKVRLSGQLLCRRGVGLLGFKNFHCTTELLGGEVCLFQVVMVFFR